MTYARDTALIATPVGMIRVEGDDDAIHRIAIEPGRQSSRRPVAPAVIAACEQLEAWFAGALRRFDIPLTPPATPRGQTLRDGLVAVRYGSVTSYGALAADLGSGPRAIGQLCARNRFPIIIPCHRVLASGGLGHYSAGDGIVTKRWLLDHEAKYRDS